MKLEQTIIFVGIIEEDHKRCVLNISKQILTASDYEVVYENIAGNIVAVSKNNKIIILFDLVSNDFHEMNFDKIHFDIVVHSFITENDSYYIDDICKMSKICILNYDDKDMLPLISKLKNVIAITYGLNSKSTVTISSVNINSYLEANLCLQRVVVTMAGEKIEPCEFCIETNDNEEKHIYPILAASTLCLIAGDSILNKKGSNNLKLII